MNILLVTMCMDIGGAETHVLELAKELSKRNNNVYVVSNGGKYVKELEKNHIEHINAPLYNKNINNIMKSYTIIKNTIKEKNIDVVHSHARIPSLICGLVCKSKKVPFVTTAHGVYKVNTILRLLTNWGQKTLVVSDDIKTYLIKQYKVNPENIFPTVNGIDIKTFSKDTDKDEILKDLNIDKQKKTVIHVSRLDTGPADVAFKLINIGGELKDKIQIIIVGAGTEYEEIKKKAEECNLETKLNTIIMAGRRTDVNKFLAAGDIFVGISRAAMEALSAKLPVILAGNVGYAGIFNENKLQISIKTNFCYRGLELPTEDMIKGDILSLIDESEEEINKLGDYGRKIIDQYYSVKKMADDALTIYNKVLKH